MAYGVCPGRIHDRDRGWAVRGRRRRDLHPLLIYVFGFSQHEAQGTSLAVLLPPIGLLAALRYYQAGHVDFKVAGLMALGFFFGASLGALGATRIPGDLLRRGFGVFLLVISLHMIVGDHGRRIDSAGTVERP